MLTWVLFAAFATTAVTAGLIWILYRVNLPIMEQARQAEARRKAEAEPQTDPE